MPRVTKWTIGAAVTLVTALGMLFAGIATAGGHSGTVSVSVTPIVVAISIANPAIDFGSVEIGGSAVTASGIESLVLPRITNNTGASVDIAVRYTNPGSAEASCPSGSNWDAGVSPDADVFVLEGDLPGDGPFATFEFPADGSTTKPIGTIADATSVDMDYQFTPPTSSTVPAGACTIGTLVVATLS